MKIALVGFGNMGKEIVKVVEQQKKNSVVSISYSDHNKKLDIKGIQMADVVIDFTSPEVVIENIKQIAVLEKNMVVGTTGWYEKIDNVKKIVKKNNIGFVYGQNFSIGANIFFKMVRVSSQLINHFTEYDVYGLEVHHTGKKDSPSGTGKKLSQIVLENFLRKKKTQFEKPDKKISSEEFHFASLRGGENPGRHEIIFDSYADEIHLVHQAHNRRGFAEGALVAAEFVKDKKGFYSFDDVFESIL